MRFLSGILLIGSFAAANITGTAFAADSATKEVEVNGATLTYIDEGTGEPVVFVHGAVSDLRAWEPIQEAITEKLRFIAPTQRYFGTGDWLDDGEKFGVGNHADDIVSFIEALDLGPVHLVGWSYGSNVAAAATLKNPDLVQSVILFEPSLASLIEEGAAGNAAREARGKMFGAVGPAVDEGDAEKATRLLIEGVFQMQPGGWDGQPEALRTMQIDNARTMPLLWSAEPWTLTCDMLKTSATPTLIVHGAESNAYWQHIAKVMDECLQNGETASLPNSNHDGPVRNPEGLAAMIIDFVAKH